MNHLAIDHAATETGTPLSVAQRVVELYLANVAKQNRLEALAKNDRVRRLAGMTVGGYILWHGPLQSSIKYRARELMGEPDARWERDGQKLVRVR